MNSNKLQASRNDTTRYLGYSERTELQLRQYLIKREYDGEIIDNVCAWAVENGFVDDVRFAEIFVKSHTERNPLASVRIKMELRAKGVSSEIIEQVLAIRDDESMFDELVKIIRMKYGKLPRRKAYGRATGYLNRRGFSSELAYRILERAFDTAGEDE